MTVGRKPILDSAWAGRAFLVPESSLGDEVDDYRRYFTSSSRKFTNSAIGGHYVINPIPQFTANCDVPHDAFFEEGLDSPSRWWSETLDDNMQIIHFRPGVPKFNSLTTFFGNFYNVNMGSIVRTGRETGLAYKVGRAIGTIGTLPLQPFILGGAAWRFFFNMPRSKYYYLSPTTFPYRYAVQTMMNAIMANEGLIAGQASAEQSQYMDAGVLPTDVDNSSYASMYGGVLSQQGFVNKAGGVDVFSISTSAARLAHTFKTRLEQEIMTATANYESTHMGVGRSAENVRRDVIDKILSNGIEKNLKELKPTFLALHREMDADGKPYGPEAYEDYYQAAMGSVADVDNWTESSLSIPPVSPEDKSGWEAFTKFTNDSLDQFVAEKNRGADFVSFRANWTGSQSENFSNQSGESSLSSQINGISSRARDIRFSMAEGNIAGGPIGKMMGSVVDGVKDLVSGALESVQLSGAIALAGNAFADIQKMYQSSSADLNRTTFTIHLRSWSADPFVRLQNIWLPLAHILCLGLPRATGPGSYDGPFLVECINQGKSLIREGLVENISIERGVGDIGWGINRETLGIDVTVTVADLSSILSIPISGGVGALTAAGAAIAGTGINAAVGTFNAIAGTSASVDGVGAIDSAVSALNKNTYSEDNKYTDYLSTITSLPLDSIIDPKRKWKLRMARMRSDMATHRTAANMGSSLFRLMPGEFLKTILADSPGRW